MVALSSLEIIVHSSSLGHGLLEQGSTFVVTPSVVGESTLECDFSFLVPFLDTGPKCSKFDLTERY